MYIWVIAPGDEERIVRFSVFISYFLVSCHVFADVWEVEARRIAERQGAAELRSHIEWNEGAMQEGMTEVLPQDVVISFVSDYSGWYHTEEELDQMG